MNRFDQFPRFCMHSAKGFNARYFWFRVFGYGLHFRWVSDFYRPCFSERHGYVKVFRIGNLWIKGLKP